MNKIVIAFGEILWDMFPTGARLGGAPFNFAYRVNMLGNRGLIVSRLGRDEPGNRAFEQVTQLGMETRYLQWDDLLPTGTVRIVMRPGHDPDITILPDVAYDAIEVTEPLLTLAGSADCCCFGTLVQRARRARQTLYRLLDASPDSLKLLDINLRKDCYSTETIHESLERADLVKVNEDEAHYLAHLFGIEWRSVPDFVSECLHRWSLAACVVTLAQRGVFAAASDGQQVYIPGYQVEMVDPVGAGDAFTAGFLDRYLSGRSLAECCQLGNVMGAIVSTHEGATSPILDEEIQRFIEAHDRRIFDPDLKPSGER